MASNQKIEPNANNPTAEELGNLLSAKQMEINALLELTQAINNNASIENLFRIYQFTLRALYQVSSIVVLYKDEDWNILYKQGIKEKDAELLKVNQDWAAFRKITRIENNNLEAPEALKWIIPVRHKEQFLAFVLMDEFREGYTTDNPSDNFVITITNIIISAVENKRLFKRQLEQARFSKELELAEEVQSMLVPSTFPDKEYLDIASYYQPYAEVGGDYYDIFPISEDEYLICIADVSGKNVSAALLMANFQATLRASSEMRFDLKRLIQYLNKRLFEITSGDRFITTLIAVYNKKDYSLRYVNAGHAPLYHLRNGVLTEMYEGSIMLGVNESLPFLDEGQMQLRKNEYLVLYTDGLTDIQCPKGTFFDPTICLKQFSENKLSAQETLDGLMKEIELFSAGKSQPDDLSILVVKVP